ncbi:MULTISPECIES: succinylglutamate desuccinylase/aspartoacylase family protein [unclassified Ornithinimicrobium]|uniref:succinylglutamate desuccinylase/aspartoacylase family protein n=1 Tax=unclassified Ornithinimicrobium TaxID=2615080 RepID=UPI0038521757
MAAARPPLRPSFAIGTVKVRTGTRREVSLPITRLVTGAEVSLPVHVLHGREDGPTVWLDAAIHGDEVVGIEVIRRVLEQLSAKEIRGTLIAVPIVNVIGVMVGDRYLPDRRDLNRSFPGSARGSLASRIAHLMMTEIVAKCDVGIDLHTASDRRSNLPQIRCDLEDPRTRALAEAFGAPVIYHARLRDGSLRSAARERGARVLLYEAGEAWRFDEWAITAGVDGVLRVLHSLGMTDAPPPASQPPRPSEICWRSGWVRARRTGILSMAVSLGQHVTVGERLGELHNSFGRRLAIVKADRDGIVIGRAEAPLVNSGDAIVHIASTDPGPPGTPDEGLQDPDDYADMDGQVPLDDQPGRPTD